MGEELVNNCSLVAHVVSDVDEDERDDGRHKEDDVEPLVVEVELELSEHLCDDQTVLRRHVHAHQKHRRDKVHALE